MLHQHKIVNHNPPNITLQIFVTLTTGPLFVHLPAKLKKSPAQHLPIQSQLFTQLHKSRPTMCFLGLAWPSPEASPIILKSSNSKPTQCQDTSALLSTFNLPTTQPQRFQRKRCNRPRDCERPHKGFQGFHTHRSQKRASRVNPSNAFAPPPKTRTLAFSKSRNDLENRSCTHCTVATVSNSPNASSTNTTCGLHGACSSVARRTANRTGCQAQTSPNDPGDRNHL